MVFNISFASNKQHGFNIICSILYWNCSREPGILKMEGIAIQIHYSSITRDLKISAEGVDGRGATVSRGTAETQDYIMQQMQQNPFQLTIHTVGTEARFNLEYKYWLHVVANGADSDNDDHAYTVKNICPGTRQALR